MEETVIGADKNTSKIKFKAPDLSKINLRRINWLTILAVLSYLHVLVLIPLLFGRKSPFIQFHVHQGIVLLFVWVLFALSFYIPLLPWVFFIYLVIAVVLGINNVVRGRERPLPIIGRWVK